MPSDHPIRDMYRSTESIQIATSLEPVEKLVGNESCVPALKSNRSILSRSFRELECRTPSILSFPV